MSGSTLTIKDLHVAIDGKEILKGVNLEAIKTEKFMQSWDQMVLVNLLYLLQLWVILNMK